MSNEMTLKVTTAMNKRNGNFNFDRPVMVHLNYNSFSTMQTREKFLALTNKPHAGACEPDDPAYKHAVGFSISSKVELSEVLRDAEEAGFAIVPGAEQVKLSATAIFTLAEMVEKFGQVSRRDMLAGRS